MIETVDRSLQERYRDRYFGKYRAFVRDNNDPERIGRVRLEIPTILGSGKDNWSDWASPCLPFGGNDDFGMFLIPDEGASVWAEFEGGNPQFPIWTGFWFAKSNPGEQPNESKRLCQKAFCKDCEDNKQHKTNKYDNKEHKKFHNHPPFYCPRLRVLFKSETGHTIYADDRDGDELFRIIDRIGQCLTFEGKVKPAIQSNNSQRRGMKLAEKGDQIDVTSKIVDKKARIQFTDACRQYVHLEAWKDKEKIHIMSCDKGRSRWQKIILDTTKGREKVSIFGLAGNQSIVIDSAKGKEKIIVKDKAGQTFLLNSMRGREGITVKDKKGGKVYLDGLTGNMMIKAANMLLVNT